MEFESLQTRQAVEDLSDLRPVRPPADAEHGTLTDLAVDLLNDTEDENSFVQLTTQIPSLALLQADFYEVLAEALDTNGGADLNEHGIERLVQLLDVSPVTNTSIELALSVLDSKLTDLVSLDNRRDLCLAAISLLHMGSEQLSVEHIARLLDRACAYGQSEHPGGDYLDDYQIQFDALEMDGVFFDLAGAAAIALLSKLKPDDLAAGLDASGLDLCEEAIRFSKQHSSEPNLLINLMQVSPSELGLQRLDNYQHDRMPAEEFRALVIRSFKEGVRLTMVLGPAVGAFLKLVFAKANLGFPQIFGPLVGTAGGLALFHGGMRFLEILREHKLSPLHRRHVEAVVAASKAEQGPIRR